MTRDLTNITGVTSRTSKLINKGFKTSWDGIFLTENIFIRSKKKKHKQKQTNKVVKLYLAKPNFAQNIDCTTNTKNFNTRSFKLPDIGNISY